MELVWVGLYCNTKNSNWNKVIHQLSQIGNPIGVSWLDLIELELVGIVSTNWKFRLLIFFHLEILFLTGSNLKNSLHIIPMSPTGFS